VCRSFCADIIIKTASAFTGAIRAVVIEVLPRRSHAAMFCAAFQSVDIRVISMAQTQNAILEPHYWCDKPEYYAKGGAHGGDGLLLNEELHQEILSDILFLSEVEIQSIVNVALEVLGLKGRGDV
jgi:hypothetical protein